MGGKSKQTQTSQTTVDPWVLGQHQEALADTKAVAAQPFQAFDKTLNLGASNDTLNNLMGFNAPTISGTSYSPITGTASTYSPTTGAASSYQAQTGTASTYDPTMIDRSKIANVDAGSVDAAAIQQFMDPYTGQVIDASMADLEKARLQAQNANNAKAISAGAYGNGARRFLQAAATDGEYDANAARTVAGLRSAGFNTALGAAQTEAARRLAAQQSNQGVDLSVNTTNAGAANNAGQFNAGQQQAMTGLNLGFQNQAGQFNAGQKQAMDLANLGFTNQAGQFNAGQTQNMDLANLGFGNDALRFGAQTQFQADQSNQGAAINSAGVRAGAAGQSAANAQAAYNAEREEFLRQQNDPFMKQAFINGQVGALPVPTSTTSTTTSKGGGGLGGILGAVGSVASGLGALGFAPFTGGASLGLMGASGLARI